MLNKHKVYEVKSQKLHQYTHKIINFKLKNEKIDKCLIQ